MTVERFNLNRMVDFGDRVVVELKDLKGKLEELANRVSEKLPAGNNVVIRRIGENSFDFSIVSHRNIVVKQFGIEWNHVTKTVTWAAVL